TVTYNQNFGPQLRHQICYNDLRPHIFDNTPQRYANLMKQCWEKDPKKRPTAAKICDILAKWQNDEKILIELSESKNILVNTKKLHSYKSKLHYNTSFYQ
ncbi:5187_t:CDS:1, partial [Cetraspora pellucida]